MQQHPGQVQGGHLDHLHHLDQPQEVGNLEILETIRPYETLDLQRFNLLFATFYVFYLGQGSP